jgi:hypothetical protein
MSLFTYQSNARPLSQHDESPRLSAAALLVELYREWDVRRQIAKAQMLDGASLRDIGLTPGGLESAIRHGRA